MLVVREKRGVSIKESLQYCLGPIAGFLATPERKIFKSVKWKFQNASEEKLTLVVCRKIVSEFLVEFVSPHNYQVAWKYWVAYQISYWFVWLIFPQYIFQHGSIMKEFDMLPVILLEYLFLEKIKNYWNSSRRVLIGVKRQELIDFLFGDWSTHPKYH